MRRLPLESSTYIVPINQQSDTKFRVKYAQTYKNIPSVGTSNLKVTFRGFPITPEQASSYNIRLAISSIQKDNFVVMLRSGNMEGNIKIISFDFSIFESTQPERYGNM